jgi:diguanylate cyclase (GGDEF)-like protein
MGTSVSGIRVRIPKPYFAGGNSGVSQALTLLLPALLLTFVYVLAHAAGTGRPHGTTRLWLAAGGALLALALGAALDASWPSDVLSAVVSATYLVFLGRQREREESDRRAREDALRERLEEASRRLVILGGRQVELEAEGTRLRERTASLEQENEKLRTLLVEKERRVHALDWRLHHERTLDDLERRNQELEDLARYDALTHLYNRRYIDHLIDKLERRLDIVEVAVALFDVDRFKAINDRYGHPIGDRVLADVAHIFRRQLRQDDVVGRYGGEEFVVLLTRTASSRTVCEKLREAVANHPWSGVAGGLRVTMSGGVALARRPFDVRGLVTEADRLLYRAKEEGRNRVVFSN